MFGEEVRGPPEARRWRHRPAYHPAPIYLPIPAGATLAFTVKTSNPPESNAVHLSTKMIQVISCHSEGAGATEKISKYQMLRFL